VPYEGREKQGEGKKYQVVNQPPWKMGGLLQLESFGFSEPGGLGRKKKREQGQRPSGLHLARGSYTSGEGGL